MYRKLKFDEEVKELEECRVLSWSGYEQRNLVVTVEYGNGERENRTYLFNDRKEYSKFLRELRKLEQ